MSGMAFYTWSMRSMSHTASRWFYISMIVGCSLLTACASKPKPRGPEGSAESKRLNLSAKQITTPQLLAFSDDASHKLAAALVARPFGETPGKSILELTELTNKSRVSNADFDLIQRRVLGTLAAGKAMRQRYDIINPEASNTKRDRSKTKAAAEENRFRLQGILYRDKKAANLPLRFDFKLIHVRTGLTIMFERYE